MLPGRGPERWPPLLSFFALWFGASGVFGQIKGALDTTWGVERKPGAGWLPVVLEYAWSVGMVGGGRLAACSHRWWPVRC